MQGLMLECNKKLKQKEEEFNFVKKNLNQQLT